ncbi:MAG TPA: RDD family protein [Panacibacter sp.]|nr:RDD family protein [Panacibacter sp.]
MAVISITTTQNIALEYDLASLGERIVATIIDLVIMGAYLFLITMVLSSSAGAFDNGAAWLYVFLFLPVAFYSLLSEQFFNGQTVGKRVMGIKVISLNGNQASFGQYLTRWLFRLVDMWLFGFVLATIMVAVTERHQRIGDLIAGTVLVKTKPRSALQQTLYTPVADTNYTANYPEVINLRDSDMQLVKEVLINVQKTGNTMLALQMMRKIEAVLNIQSKHAEPVNFLYAILSDYNHLTAKL